MRRELIVQSLRQRIGNRSYLALAIMVGTLLTLFRLGFGPGPVSIQELVLPFLFVFIHLIVSPIPWQWTGNDELRANVGRGFVQALFFNGAWLGLMLAVMPAVRPDLPPSMRPERRPSPGIVERKLPPRYMPEMTLGLINLIIAIAFGWIIADKEASEAKERRTADMLRQTRLKALQNQLEPHVLYNALSSLSELVYEDPLAAEDVITKLADLYRMLSVHGKQDFVLLGEERKLVEAYLAMEQMRLGERLKVRWDWPSWADDYLIPPLALQTVVENAIKHGISPSAAGGEIQISCKHEDSLIQLQVRNSGASWPSTIQNGAKLGLENLQARLELWAGAPGRFTLESEDAWTVATLQWKTESPA